MSMIQGSGIKEQIRALIEVASEMPTKAEKDALLDRIIEKVVGGVRIEDIATQIASPVAASAPQRAPQAAKVAPPPAKEARPAGGATAGVGEPPAEVKRGRGRPRTKPKPKYDPKHAVLSLLDDFGVADETTRRRLERLVVAARAKSDGGRGIPQTESPSTYRFLRRGGPIPKASVFLVDGQRHEVVPPIVSKGSGGDANAIWVEFEKLLLGIEEASSDPEETKRRENTIRFSRSMQSAGISWIEGSPTVLAGHAVPSVTADTARKILARVDAFAKKGPEFLEMAPAVWLDDSGAWTDELATIMRDVHLGKVAGFGRKERFALARMLLEPLGSIENLMFEIAFPSKLAETGEQ